MSRKWNDYKTGDTVGSCTLMEEVEKPQSRKHALFRCSCGSQFRAIVRNVRSGVTKTCGCLHRKILFRSFTKHGGSISGRHHLYKRWLSIRRRCSKPSDPQFKHYGARGVSICHEWASDFTKFRDYMISIGWSDIGEIRSIDRINNDGDYSPGNVRMASARIQGNNTRRNVFYDFHGERLTVRQISDKTGIPTSRIRSRIHAGESAEESVITKRRWQYTL